MSTLNPVPSFSIKKLRFTFTLANNAKFAGTNSNVLTVSGLRSQARIKASGLPAFPEAEVTIYGLLQQDMIALTALAFQPLAMLRNTVVVEANGGAGWSTVFSGQIITGGPDYNNLPHVPYKAQCRVLGFESLNPATPTSYTGPTDVGQIVGAIASKMGYAFSNAGVNQTLDSPYLDNTLPEQLRKVKEAAGIEVYIEGNIITIAPPGVARSVPSFTLSPPPSGGLIGYPRLDYQRGFVNVKAVFNAAFRFGGPITVTGSDVITANGSWVVGTLSHALDALLPGGVWESDMLLYPPNSGIPPTS